MVAAGEFGAKGVGIEIDPLRYFISKFRVAVNNLSPKINVLRKNFFDVDIKDASVVFVYLVPKALAKLKEKLLKELKPGTKIVSYRYKMDLPLVSYEAKNKIYLYKMPSS